jgi:hypothetical protein
MAGEAGHRRCDELMGWDGEACLHNDVGGVWLWVPRGHGLMVLALARGLRASERGSVGMVPCQPTPGFTAKGPYQTSANQPRQTPRKTPAMLIRRSQPKTGGVAGFGLPGELRSILKMEGVMNSHHLDAFPNLRVRVRTATSIHHMASGFSHTSFRFAAYLLPMNSMQAEPRYRMSQTPKQMLARPDES